MMATPVSGYPVPPLRSPSYSPSMVQHPSHEQTTNTLRTASGPPLPPPPPLSNQQSLPPYPPSHPQTPYQQHESQPQLPQPPAVGEPWLPPLLLSKTTAQLSPLLQPSPQDPSQPNPLLTSLTYLHPSLHPSASPLPPLLSQTTQLATHLSSRHAHLLHLRQQTQSHLLQLHGLERQWRDKQRLLDKELEPWSAKRLYERLRVKEREGEDVGLGVEGSWLDGNDHRHETERGGGGGDDGIRTGSGAEGTGMMSEREVADFLRGWREGRARVWRRREMRERWDEGRVGGWR